jgi:hypothetical protein
MRKIILSGILMLIVAILNTNQAESKMIQLNTQKSDSISFSISFNNKKQKPVDVPIVPALSQERPYYNGGQYGRAVQSSDYQPGGDGAFIKENGAGSGNYLITTGVWRLMVGDKPVIGLSQRLTSGAYANPGLMPNLGVTGRIRLKIRNTNTEKWLEDFTNIKAVLKAGEAQWDCKDDKLNMKVLLTVNHFIDEYGCGLTAQIVSQNTQQVELEWYYESADFVKDHQNYTEFACKKYTQIFVGSTNENATYNQGVTKTTLQLKPEEDNTDTYICVWGYKNYDKTEIDSAYKRLQFRPTPSKDWTEQMKINWFQHWIGRGLNPEQKFLAILKNPGLPFGESKAFWQSMRNRVRIKTGDVRFDNAIQALGSRMIYGYEYPGYLHASNYMKYGKINSGMYGHEAAGFHDEVASSLKLITAAQDVKGRQRYIMPNFRISYWAEEMNPYYIDQVWYHYRWTGDKDFLYDMWPSVRKALEHLITTSDPENDGIYTGFYENWGSDQKNRGGKCSLMTGLGITALRNGFNMATILEDVDYELGTQETRGDNDFRARYKRLLEKAIPAYETLYNKRIGAYSSSDWDGELRNKPDNDESNYAIWREVGSLFNNYTSMRFIRDNYHEKTPNGTIEFVNRNWPVCWSNHFDSFTEAMASIASAATVNDINHFYPVLKTAVETVYTKNDLTVNGGGNSVFSLESDQMLMMALLDNIFGIKPYFGNNLLIIRPSFPDSWKNPEIDLPDVSYKYFKGSNEINLKVKTPVNRLLQAEIPVNQSVKEVTVNGEKVNFDIRKEVNYCRLIIKSSSSKEHLIKVLLDPKDDIMEGNVSCQINMPAIFKFRNAELVNLHNPQIYFGEIKANSNQIIITPEILGNYTVFAELKKGNVAWYQPLELKVNEIWSFDEQYKAWDGSNPAKTLSPKISADKQKLSFQITNNTVSNLKGEMTIEVYGQSIHKNISLLANQSGNIEVPLTDIRGELSPGSIPFKVKFYGLEKTSHAVDWELGISFNKENIVPLDIRNYYNINIEKLYGNSAFLTWRSDYTGAAVGVDWRANIQIDKYGYQTFVEPSSLLAYGTLHEQKPTFPWLSLPNLTSIDTMNLPISFPCLETQHDMNNIMALINTENNRSIPSEAIIDLAEPIAVKKIYLLMANLTKVNKSYYPGAEVEIIYEYGKSQIVQLIPPFNMPTLIPAQCPDALNILIGTIEDNQIFLHGNKTGLALTDLVTDSNRKIRAVKLRCVSTETVFGIIGITLLSKK